MTELADTPLSQLIVDCLIEGNSASWPRLLSQIEELVRRTFFSVEATLPYATFQNWFPGWLYSERKLVAAHRALQQKVATGEIASSGEADRYLRNYLVPVIHSAIGDWQRQHKPLRTSPGSRNEPGRHEAAGDETERVRSELFHLSPELRVPFWLRHIQALGDLPEYDLVWIAELSSLSRQRVEDEIATEAQRVFPKSIASEFIGELLQLHCLSNGKYAAVDQRIRRARDIVRQRMCLEGEAAT